MMFLKLSTTFEAFIIIFIAVLTGFTVNLFHPKGYVMTPREELGLKNIVPISTDEAKIKFDAGSAVFLDARDEDEYNAGHINPSINLPFDSEKLSFDGSAWSIAELNAHKEPVIYCGGTGCGVSQQLAERLVSLGYARHIYVIAGGYSDWEKRGYPVERREVN
jgi:rhodanese-related sulfurtransferase